MASTRKGSPNQDRPVVRGGKLHLPDENNGPVCVVGSDEWKEWLEEGEGFYFDGGDGLTMSVGRYMRSDGKGGKYPAWVATKWIDGSTTQRYIGKAKNIYTLDGLRSYAEAFTE